MWSRDGTGLFYRRLAGRERQLRSVDVTTGPDFGFTYERTLPLDTFVIEGFQRDYDITRDSDKPLLVFPAADPDQTGSRPERIHIVVNWHQELLERVPVP